MKAIKQFELPKQKKENTMQELRININFRDKTMQTLKRNVATGNKIDLSVLHQNILSLQAETNKLLTAVVETEKQKSSTAVKNSHTNGKD